MANSSDDFSQVISEELTCPICLEELKEPKMLRCSHNICRECLERMPMFEKISCPVCRKPTRIPKGGVRCLPTNAAIVRVVEATLVRKARVQMPKSLETAKPKVELLAKRISDFDKALKVLNEIHEKADKLVDVIRNQEASFCREIEEFYGIKCETINEDKSDLDKMHSDASRSVQEAETILKQTKPDSTKTINVANALTEQMEEINKIDLKQDTSEDLQFEINAVANISRLLKDEKFGKLTTKSTSHGKVIEQNEILKQIETTQCKSCMICNNKIKYYCQMCKKRSCKSCITVVTILPCHSNKEHLRVEVNPNTSSDKADLDSKDDCSFCGFSTASHYCIFCDMKSCATCPTIYTKDPCVMGKETHYFVNQQQQKALERQTGTQNETTLSSRDKKPNSVSHVTGENYCDFCALAADLICKSCLKTICDKCKHVYKQDLCPPTKREHQFENINEQSPNTNEAAESSSWSCERCKFLNSPSHRICPVCATSRGVNQVDLPKSSRRTFRFSKRRGSNI